MWRTTFSAYCQSQRDKRNFEMRLLICENSNYDFMLKMIYLTEHINSRVVCSVYGQF